MSLSMLPARTRFAPSPTGRMHLGGARTALFDYLLARQTGGQFILRLEDTDQKRFVPGSEEDLMRGLKWLGLNWDEGLDIGGPYAPYRQTERRDIYQSYIKRLIDSGQAYYCFCTPDRLEEVRQQQRELKIKTHYDGKCRNLDPDDAAHRVAQGEKFVVRFKTPKEGSITVRDRIRGPVTVENSQIDDSVLIKSDGLAVYHFAAMVDDYEMKISHVIRGSEWLPSFPLHAHIMRSLKFPEPEFIHLSVFLKPTGKGKMGKRDAAELIKDGFSIYLGDMEELGFLPEAVANWIALMGWSYDDHTEFFTMQDLINKFSIDHLTPAPAAINFTKLDHFNRLHIRNMSQSELAKSIKPFLEKAGYSVKDDMLYKIIPVIRERLGGLDDAPEKAGFFFQEEINLVQDDILANKMTAEESIVVLKRFLAVLESSPDMTPSNVEAQLHSLINEFGLSTGQVFGLFRSVITGKTASPPLLETMEIIGRAKVLERIRNAIKILDHVT